MKLSDEDLDTINFILDYEGDCESICISCRECPLSDDGCGKTTSETVDICKKKIKAHQYALAADIILGQ